MEDTTWEQRIHALTHVITSPATSPTLHSQFFIATQVPCHIHWDYPPILCTKSSKIFHSIHLKWAFLTFLERVSRFNLPKTSWRSKCPYQIPPPVILAKGVEEAQWGEAEKREYVRKRFRRRRLGRGGQHTLVHSAVIHKRSRIHLALDFIVSWFCALQWASRRKKIF